MAADGAEDAKDLIAGGTSSNKRGTKRKREEVGQEIKKKQAGIKGFFHVKTSGDSTKAADAGVKSSRWTWKGTIMFFECEGVCPSSKIAAFDFDNTLAKTSVFKPGPNSWSVLYASCQDKLTCLHQDGYKLVIFTNQAGIARSKNKSKVVFEKQSRLEGFVKKVNLPFQIFVATAHDGNRKPNTGMWQCLVEQCNGGLTVDLSESFFVGDAAGRTKDHSDSDKQFAAKCKLKFCTEDDFFSLRSAKLLQNPTQI